MTEELRKSGEMLSKLLKVEKNGKMTKEEAFEQRVSFLYSQLRDHAPNMTMDHVRKWLREGR